MTIRAFMVWPDSQIKASKGPAVSMLCCWMIRAFHGLGKTLCRTWQASLFPVQYAEQPLSMDWAQTSGTYREATNSMCICKYWQLQTLIFSTSCLSETALSWPVQDLCRSSSTPGSRWLLKTNLF